MIPSRDQCFILLERYYFPDRKRRHIELVEKVAVFLGKRLKLKDKSVDLDLVSAGALLHDIDKGIEGAGTVHPKKGVEILRAEGYLEVARICETHAINAFLDPATIPATREEKCVALADKMVKDAIITVDERYRLWNEENLPPEQRLVLKKTYPLLKELEREIFSILQIKPEEVRQRIMNGNSVK